MKTALLQCHLLLLPRLFRLLLPRLKKALNLIIILLIQLFVASVWHKINGLPVPLNCLIASLSLSVAGFALSTCASSMLLRTSPLLPWAPMRSARMLAMSALIVQLLVNEAPMLLCARPRRCFSLCHYAFVCNRYQLLINRRHH